MKGHQHLLEFLATASLSPDEHRIFLSERLASEGSTHLKHEARLKPLQRKAAWFQFLCFYFWQHLGLFLLSGISYQSMTGPKCTFSLCDWPSKARFSDICPQKLRRRATHTMKMILTVWVLEQSSCHLRKSVLDLNRAWKRVAGREGKPLQRRVHVEEIPPHPLV